MSLSKRKKLRMKERAEKKLKKEKDVKSEQSTPSRPNFTDEGSSVLIPSQPVFALSP
jgi:phage terminase small subunit